MVVVRPETFEDIPVIREINEKAFGRTDEACLVDAVRKTAGPIISLVAVQDVQIVGHILFSPVTVESSAGTRPAVGLGPLAVLPDFQRHGVGSRLVERGLEVSREAGYEVAVVLGHPTYYPRFGFSVARVHGIHWERDVPGDAFMAMELQPGALEKFSGIVRYLPEFMSV